MKLKIKQVPDPILRRQSKPILKITPATQKLAQQMIAFIKKGGGQERIGVGLSAVQLGRLKRLFVVFLPKKKQDHVFVNPEITWRSAKLTKGVPERDFPYEGCLSVPGFLGLVKRHWAIKLKYQTLTGRPCQEKFSGFVATVIQHEMDHLNGVLFVDRVIEQKSKLFQIKKNQRNQNTLAEVEWS